MERVEEVRDMGHNEGKREEMEELSQAYDNLAYENLIHGLHSPALQLHQKMQ